MRLGSRSLLLVLLAGMVPASSSSAARQAGPDAPHVVYSTYLGTSNFEGVADIAVASDGSIVLLLSSQPNSTVMRLSADGKTVLGQRTIRGGVAGAMALGPDGAIYVVGQAQDGLLETVRPFQASAHGLLQGFVAKVSADAKQLLFCSYLGGSRSDGVTEDAANDVAVDDDGLMYVAGKTQGSNNDFPVVNPTQATYGGGYTDGFLSVIDADAGSLVFSTYVGEEGDDDLKTLTVDPQTKTIVTGGSTILPEAARGATPCETARTRLGLWQRSGLGTIWDEVLLSDMCVEQLKLDAAIEAFHRRLDENDNRRAWLFLMPLYGPLNDPDSLHGSVPEAPQRGGVSSMNLELSVYDEQLNLVRKTTFGGPADEYPKSIAIDETRGIAYVIGEADGVGLPTVSAFQPAYGGGGADSFVAAFDLTTLQPLFVSYLGGSGIDYPGSIALDADGNILLGGSTSSADFPLTADATQSHSAGLSDGFFTKISPLGDIVPDFGLSVDPSTLTVARGASGTITVNVGRTGGFDGKVTVKAPDTKAIKVKLTPPSASTDGASVTFKVKVKKKAAAGTADLVFTGTDANGKARTATLSLTVQ